MKKTVPIQPTPVNKDVYAKVKPSKLKYGLYSKYFTREEIARFDSMSTSQFLEQVKIDLLVMWLELAQDQGLTPAQRLEVARIFVGMMEK